MRTVRGKLLFIVAVCVVPMALATLFISAALEQEQRDDAAATVGAAKRAFSAELDDDASDLEAAVQLFVKDPEAARAIARGDRTEVYDRLAHYTVIYPGMRVIAVDAQGKVVATSGLEEGHGSLAQEPLVRAALAGGEVEEAVRLALPGEEPAFYYALAKPVGSAAAPAGALLAATLLDAAFFSRLAAKANLGFALFDGGRLIAASPGAYAGRVALGSVRVLDDGPRTLALTSFTSGRLAGGAPQPQLIVGATLDLTELTRDHRRFLAYRLLLLLLIAAIAVAVALFVASRMGRSVDALARVLPGIAERRYEPALVVRTGDELQALAETYNGMIVRLKEGDLWRRALGKYLSRAALSAVMNGDLQLGGTLLPATVLFSDIRGFTTMAEGMDPVQVLGVLNRYFTEMVSAVIHHQGIVDKFIGDAIMAVWGPPQPSPDDALNAVRAALAMRERLERLNQRFAEQGLPILRTGIGIHSGPVVAGNMGAEGSDEPGEEAQAGKMEYTVIGDAVNVASRLESLTKELHVEVLLSEDTVALVKDRVRVEALKSVLVKGRSQPIMVYRLLGLIQTGG